MEGKSYVIPMAPSGTDGGAGVGATVVEAVISVAVGVEVGAGMVDFGVLETITAFADSENN